MAYPAADVNISEPKVWSINKQHVCIYAKIVFSDAFNLGKSQTSNKESPTRRISRFDIGLEGFTSGGPAVNIFDLADLIAK